jgi:phosphohistidine phosphatase
VILYLVRHAKSSWNEHGLADHERPLNNRGLTDAPRMFARLRANAAPPEVILSSDAVRAASTATMLLEALALDAGQLSFEARLYHAGVEQIISTARNLPDSISTAAIVGHNPGLTYAANHLADNLELDNLPTCGIVGIEFPADSWRAIETGMLHYFDYPKNLDGPLLRSPASP